MSQSLVLPQPGGAIPLTIGVPPEGGRGITVSIPFSGSVTNASIDLSQFLQSAKMTKIQSVFVNNWNNSEPFSITIPQTGIVIWAPANSQGWYELPFPATGSQLQFYSNGGTTVTLQLVNFAVEPQVWTNGGSGEQPTVTANQGAAGGSPWAMDVYVNGEPISTSNTVPVSDAGLGSTLSPFANPPVSGEEGATSGIIVSGVVNNPGTYGEYEDGSQLPFLLTSQGYLSTSDNNFGNIISYTGTGGVAATFAAVQVAFLYEPYGSYPTLTAGEAAMPGMTALREVLTSDKSVVTAVERVQGVPGSATVPGYGNFIVAEVVAANPSLTAGNMAGAYMTTSGRIMVDIGSSVTVGGAFSVTYQAAPTELTNGGTVNMLGDSYGAQIVSTESLKPTYSGSSSNTFTTTTAGVVAYLQGSATKTIRVKRVFVTIGGTGTTGTAGIAIRSRTGTAFSGGTGASAGIAQHDYNDPAQTALLEIYTAAPTTVPATINGSFRSMSFSLGAAFGFNQYEFDFSNTNDKAIVLRGTTQYATVEVVTNSAAQALAYSISVEWTEE